MRSPEGLAIARAGQALIRHLVLLTCKLPARTDRDPNTTLQVCEKWTLTDFPALLWKFPASFPENPCSVG
jgi:hypothetical protein